MRENINMKMVINKCYGTPDQLNYAVRFPRKLKKRYKKMLSGGYLLASNPTLEGKTIFSKLTGYLTIDTILYLNHKR